MKTRRSRRSRRSSRSRRSRKHIGGKIRDKCLPTHDNFPKCGKEGCVFLNDDNTVTKKQWKTMHEMPSHQLSTEGQTLSSEFAPNINSSDFKTCNLITMEGVEQPCFVKRYRNTRTGKKILYEEEERPTWCKNYGIQNKCVVDRNMYDHFKNNIPKISSDKIPKHVALPDIDSLIDGDTEAIDSEDLGDMYGEAEIDDTFTYLNPIFLTKINMDRIKGITIFELMEEMFKKLGIEKTMTVQRVWEEEKEKIISQVADIGYTSPDFNEQNIMIDVDNEELCSWIDLTLDSGIPITPEMVKNEFGKDSILKIVDWGLLQRTK